MNKFEKNSAAKAEYLEKINEEWQNFHQIADIWYTFISRAIIHRGFFSYADFNFRNENSTPCKPCLDEQKLFAALGRNIQPAAEKCHQNFFLSLSKPEIRCFMRKLPQTWQSEITGF